ncbi:MAG: hypothetical protein MZV70_00320 [Desulfobacterales bacterium]|nr:hypothetical protein [Desulfobacterales bacterium]
MADRRRRARRLGRGRLDRGLVRRSTSSPPRPPRPDPSPAREYTTGPRDQTRALRPQRGAFRGVKLAGRRYCSPLASENENG